MPSENESKYKKYDDLINALSRQYQDSLMSLGKIGSLNDSWSTRATLGALIELRTKFRSLFNIIKESDFSIGDATQTQNLQVRIIVANAQLTRLIKDICDQIGLPIVSHDLDESTLAESAGTGEIMNEVKNQGMGVLDPIRQTETAGRPVISHAVITAINELKGQLIKLQSRKGDDCSRASSVLYELIQGLDNTIELYHEGQTNLAEFNAACKTLLTQRETIEILSKPRGSWSVTRQLDKIAKIIDSCIDRFLGHNTPESKTTATQGFFHVKTTSERKVDKMTKAIEASKEPSPPDNTPENTGGSTLS